MLFLHQVLASQPCQCLTESQKFLRIREISLKTLKWKHWRLEIILQAKK